MAKKISILFASGAVGGLAFAIAMWGLGEIGLTHALKVYLAPELRPLFLYHAIVWGGIWGLLFIIPIADKSPLAKGLLLSIVPSLVELMYFMPHPVKAGIFSMMGTEGSGGGYFGQYIGTLTPLFIFIYYAVWGVVTALWLKMSGGK